MNLDLQEFRFCWCKRGVDGRGNPAPTQICRNMHKGHGTRRVPTTLDCAILGFVAEDLAGVGDVESWGFMPALPVDDSKVNPFDINAAAD